MIMGDHLAIFGGFVMFNFELTSELVEVLLTTNMPEGRRLLLDGVIAPSITPEAIEMLVRKKDKCRIMVNPALANLNKDSLDTTPRLRPARGGFLVQPNYTYILNLQDPQLVITGDEDQIDKTNREDLILAWAVGCTSNSNTTTVVKNGQLIGNGVGQQSRVASCQVAIFRTTEAGHSPKTSVAYTDSFFPEPDGPEVLANAGVKIVFASSGSVKDEIIRAKCKELGIILVQLPDVVCRGFFGH
jgi:phosphoribosylaminoimidazolecarboxamide formyltransferase / IMP cyclohydrolase